MDALKHDLSPLDRRDVGHLNHRQLTGLARAVNTDETSPVCMLMLPRTEQFGELPTPVVKNQEGARNHARIESDLRDDTQNLSLIVAACRRTEPEVVETVVIDP